MSFTGVDASPLRAAREWRGMSLVAAARASGVHMAQAEALEEGDLGAFGSVEEMVAAAVLYGATLGVGRDEAMALLDRTLTAMDQPVAVELPEEVELQVEEQVRQRQPQPAAFSVAVRSRSSRSLDATSVPVGAGAGFAADVPSSRLVLEDVPELADPPEIRFEAQPFESLEGFDGMPAPHGAVALPDAAVLPEAHAGVILESDLLTSEPEHHVSEPSDMERTGELPILPTGGLEGAHQASQLPDNPTVRAAMELDPHWRRAMEHRDSELDQWVSERGGNSSGRAAGGSSVIGKHVRAASERVLGPERTDGLAERAAGVAEAARGQVRELRRRLERSEHATLIVAVGVGILLVAALVGIASATGGKDEAAAPKAEANQVEAPKPPAGSGDGSAATPKAAAADPAAGAAAAKPMLAPAQLRLHVLNAGRRTGYAHTVADRLEARKYKVENVGNTKTRYGADVILHPPSLAREADRLSKQTGITTLDAVAEVGGSPTITIIVV